MPRSFDDVAECVETTLSRVGPDIVLALPLGIGPPLMGAVTSRGVPSALRPYLDRMSLGAPRTRQQWLWQRLLVQELRVITQGHRGLDCF
jgi:hypothetical protein